MSLGRRRTEQKAEFWVATRDLAGGPGRLFYDRINELLIEARFDKFVETLCEPNCEPSGRASISPGRHFHMLLVGSFEGIDSQRGIAVRCPDSLSLRRFLFLELSEESPDHSSLTNTRNRLSATVFHGSDGDAQTLPPSLVSAQTHLGLASRIRAMIRARYFIAPSASSMSHGCKCGSSG